MEIYPLRFEPIYKERLWGGQKLREVLGKEASGANLGESWEISGVAGNASVVSNGPYAGRSMVELLEAYPEALLGKAVYARFGNAFPILIKFIDARLDLSIQLHPDDALAQKRHDSFGKTEMWYILQAEQGSQLISGFKQETEKAGEAENQEISTLLLTLLLPITRCLLPAFLILLAAKLRLQRAKRVLTKNSKNSAY